MLFFPCSFFNKRFGGFCEVYSTPRTCVGLLLNTTIRREFISQKPTISLLGHATMKFTSHRINRSSGMYWKSLLQK